MKLLRYSLILFLLPITSQQAFSQALEGLVTNTEGKGILYAQLGINATSIYQLSDAQGKFSISIPKSMRSKSLTVLAPGYKTTTHNLDSLFSLKEVVIILQKDIQEVSGTQVTSGKLKTRVKGNKVPPIGAMQMSLSQSHTSYAITLKTPGKQAFMSSIAVNVSNDTILNFTLRPFAYALIDDEPDYSRNLIPENKIFHFSVKKGWLTMDLSDLEVEVSGHIIFGVEWIAIEGPSNTLTSIALTFMGGGNSFERIGLQNFRPYRGPGSFAIKGTFEFY